MAKVTGGFDMEHLTGGTFGGYHPGDETRHSEMHGDNGPMIHEMASKMNGDPAYPPADPKQPQYPPGSPGWKQAGSPRIMGENGEKIDIPSNTNTQGMKPRAYQTHGEPGNESRTNGVIDREQVGGPIQQPAISATAPADNWKAQQNGDGTYSMKEQTTGMEGRKYNFGPTPAGPASEWDANDPALQSELSKATAMYNEPNEVKQAAASQMASGDLSPSLKSNPLEKPNNFAAGTMPAKHNYAPDQPAR